MSIATAIQNARNKIASAYAKVDEMGGTLPVVQNLDNLPSAIESVTTLDPLINGSITEVDTNVSSIRMGAFANCSNLTSVTLRSNTLINLTDSSIFENTPIANKTGNIYVPSNLVTGYEGMCNIAFKGATQNSTLSGFNWEGVVYNGTNYIALDNRGYFAISTDGIAWTLGDTEKRLSLSSSWQDIVFNGTQYAAIGELGAIAVSSDGLNWSEVETSASLGQEPGWFTLTYGNNTLMAINKEGYISTSIDGINWSTPIRKIINSDRSPIQASIYDGTKFIALSQGGTVSTSTDGNIWTSAILLRNDANWEDMIYDGTSIIALGALGSISISYGGAVWTEIGRIPSPANVYWESLGYDGTKFIALSRVNGYTSYTEPKYNFLPISE